MCAAGGSRPRGAWPATDSGTAAASRHEAILSTIYLSIYLSAWGAVRLTALIDDELQTCPTVMGSVQGEGVHPFGIRMGSDDALDDSAAP